MVVDVYVVITNWNDLQSAFFRIINTYNQKTSLGYKIGKHILYVARLSLSLPPDR